MRGAWMGAVALLLGCTFGSSGEGSGGASGDGTGSTGAAEVGDDDDDDDTPETTGGGGQEGDDTVGVQPGTGETVGETMSDDDDDDDSTSTGADDDDDDSTSTGAPTTGGSSSTGQPAAFGCEDADNDGAGDPGTCQFDPPDDYVDNDLDCDDSDPYLGPCPALCSESTPMLSCAGDFEAIATGVQPACPQSDLMWSASPGPNDYAVITCQTLMDAWYGHGLHDHTTSAADGNVFYGDLGSSPPVGAAYYREPITVQADTTYMIHLWIKNTATDEPASTDPTIGIRVDGVDRFVDYTVVNYTGDVDTWDEISVLYESDADETIDVEVVNWAGSIGSSGLDIAIDDVTIVGCD